MTPSELILNFVRQYTKPFNLQTAASMTNLDIAVVEPILQQLLADGVIKIISETEGIYSLANRYHSRIGYNQKGKWRYDTQDATMLLNHIESEHYASIREIAEGFGRSRQWVFAYMEALASLDMIGFGDNGYHINTRDNIEKLGINIIPGVLKELRENYYIEKRQKQAIKKAAQDLEVKKPTRKAPIMLWFFQ